MKVLFFLCLIKLVSSQLDGSFWWKETTTLKPATTVHENSPSAATNSPLTRSKDVVCCECVPFFLCVNGTINTDGSGVLDLRIGGEKITTTPAPAVNVEYCPDSLNICCQVPDVDPSCLGENNTVTTTESYATPPPDSNCECVVHSECDPFLIVSNNLGLTSVQLSNGRIVSHSKCFHSLEVCCYLPDFDFFANITISTPSPDISTSANLEESCECVLPNVCGSDGHIKTDGAGLLDQRIGSPSPPKPCPHDASLVCCLPPKDEYESSSCECVQPNVCGSDGHIKTVGAGLLDQRIGSPNPPKPCPYDPSLVCCLPPKDEYESSTQTPTTIPTTLPPPPPCGTRNKNGLDVRILGFKESQTQFGEFPWVATLLKSDYVKDNHVLLFVGGASLIHPRVVMTAAHKIKDVPVESLVVRLGEWDTASTKEYLAHQDAHVQEIIVHPQYNPTTLFHDVALLVLEEYAATNFHINPICPAKSLDEVIPSTCVVNGWGVDAFRSENYQELMKSVRLPLVRKGPCQRMLRKTRLSRYFNLHSSFICAGGEEGIDSCKGDGGGPLACQRRDDPSRYVQVGITAWGIGCGGKDIPGVYVDVAHHFSWIMDHVAALFPGQQPTHTTHTTQRPLTKAEKKELRKQKRKEERQKQREQQRKENQEQRKREKEQNIPPP